MDIAGAFNNVVHPRLIHNLKQRRIPPTIARWVQNFIETRTTQLRFNDETHEAIPIRAGIPQGSPISPILHILYNADLLDPHYHSPIVDLALGFIDDIAYGVKGASADSNVKALEIILNDTEGWR